MKSIESQIIESYKDSYMRAESFGFEFDPVSAYQESYDTMPSCKHLIGNGTDTYWKALDTKILRSYLGMREKEQQAMRNQLSHVQIWLNELFGVVDK
jgi:hypothetical protein